MVRKMAKGKIRKQGEAGAGNPGLSLPYNLIPLPAISP